MLNETNITIDAASVLINSQTEANNLSTLISQILISLVASVTTGVITGLITYYTITNNIRSIYIQANQPEIREAMIELSKRIDRGQSQEIKEFLNSSQGIFIPKTMRIKLREKCSVESLPPEQITKILDEINGYISP